MGGTDLTERNHPGSATAPTSFPAARPPLAAATPPRLGHFRGPGRSRGLLTAAVPVCHARAPRSLPPPPPPVCWGQGRPGGQRGDAPFPSYQGDRGALRPG